MRRRIRTAAVLLLGVLVLFAGAGKGVAYAGNEPAEDAFSGEVGMLKQDGSNYVMQVTVENSGEDFTGTVQVIFESSGMANGNCAYETEITLPAQGRKQYTITVPQRAVETVRGRGALNFLDGKGNLVQSITLTNVFGNALQGIPVGILSDHYSGLTYLDAGGEDFSFQNMSYPLKLVELDDSNLQGYLDGLYFLIIDQFNVASLSQEHIQAIQEWVEGGGCLLIGTGAYGEQTLSGFDEDFLGVDVLSVSEPPSENFLTVNAGKYGYYYFYDIVEADLTQMAVADLDYYKLHNYYESTDHPFVCSSIGDGAAAVFFYSLGEKELQKLENYMILSMYSEILYQSNSYNLVDWYSDLEYTGQRALAFIDSRNTDVDFGLLKVLIGIYVVVVGPVLYLILRKCKRSEWYWVGVPVLGLVFIAAVFFLGNGAKVNETRVYSVTAQRADSNQEDTYFLAYHSGTKPWEIHLEDRYEVAGPGWSGYRYYGGNSSGVKDYYYMVGMDSQGLSVGVKPEENFESAFLYAGGKTEAKGSLRATGLMSASDDGYYYGVLEGAVTNDTSWNMDYLAVWADSYIMVFSDVKAGENLDLRQAVEEGRCVYQSSADEYSDLLYSMVDLYNNSPDIGYEQDDMAALLIGLGLADDARTSGQGDAVIAGVIRDYERAVADKCSETSYGCLYSYAEMEGEQDAAN